MSLLLLHNQQKSTWSFVKIFFEVVYLHTHEMDTQFDIGLISSVVLTQLTNVTQVETCLSRLKGNETAWFE